MHADGVRIGELHVSPSMDRKQVEHIIEMDEAKYHNEWHSCCTDKSTDARLLKWIAQVAFSSVAFGFAFAGLLTGGNDALTPFYTGLIGSIVGLHVNLDGYSKKEE